MPLEPISVKISCFKKHWDVSEQEWVTRIINEHFDAHDDWTHAAFDMGLQYEESFQLSDVNDDDTVNPFAAFVVTKGDFYVEVGVLIQGFSVTNDGIILLIGQDDEAFHPVFFPIN